MWSTSRHPPGLGQLCRGIRNLATAPSAAALGRLSLANRANGTKREKLSFEENRDMRNRHLSPAQKLHYEGTEAGPLKLVTGRGQYLYDSDGTEYLDCVNNVCHVGHCHPRIVEAASAQLATLNTNSRYLHDNIVYLAKKVASSMPDPLEIVVGNSCGRQSCLGRPTLCRESLMKWTACSKLTVPPTARSL